MIPINDLAKIEVSQDNWFNEKDDSGVENGILVELPKELPYFGFQGFAFEESLGNKAKSAELLDFYRQFVGKRVYWSAYSERGSVLREGDKTFAFVKLTALIAFSEPEVKAESVGGDKAVI